MGFEVSKNDGRLYLYIIKGKLMRNVSEETEGAIARAYEKSDGSKGVKHELKYDPFNAFLTDIKFKDSDFGEQCILVFKSDDQVAQVQMSVDGKYFQDFAKKISNIYLDMEFKFGAYDWEPEPGKKKTGVTIQQEGQKILSWFWDPETKKTLNGFPQPEKEWEKLSKDELKIHFIKVKGFLRNHVEKVWTAQQLVNAEQAAKETATIEQTTAQGESPDKQVEQVAVVNNPQSGDDF